MFFGKYKNYIYSGIITIIIGYFLFTFLFTFRNCHRVKFDNYKEYLWLFQDSVKSKIDTFFCAGEVRTSDALYWYNLYNISRSKVIPNFQYHVIIWEFKEVMIDLTSINFNENISFNEVKINSGEKLNPKSTPSIKVKFKIPFKNSINVNLNENSKVQEMIESKNYRGFYGTINKLSLSNEKGEHLILFDNGFYEIPTLLFFYKYHHRFFLIYLTGEKEFNENIIRIFNLKN